MKQLMRWEDPFAGISSLHNHIDDMFNEFFTGSRLPALANVPAMDVYNEDDKRLVAEIQTPGFNKNDVEVSVQNGVLEIKGEKHEKEEDKERRNYMVRESSASFYRRVVLPKHADADNVEAHFDDGMLRVVVPFKELPQPKRVQIKAGRVKK